MSLWYTIQQEMYLRYQLLLLELLCSSHSILHIHSLPASGTLKRHITKLLLIVQISWFQCCLIFTLTIQLYYFPAPSIYFNNNIQLMKLLLAFFPLFLILILYYYWGGFWNLSYVLLCCHLYNLSRLCHILIYLLQLFLCLLKATSLWLRFT